jgi:hypothetical protein
MKISIDFGKDHLVLVGDFVDRGVMVTEVLVLFIEEKAKAAGGYVLFWAIMRS